MASMRFLRVGVIAALHSDLAHRRINALRQVRDRDYPNWSLHLVDGRLVGMERLRQLRVDGIIAESGSLAAPPEPGIPLVHYGSRHHPGFPWVDTDHAACGRLAAQALRAGDRAGYAHLTWPDHGEVWRLRRLGFATACAPHQPAVHAFTSVEGLSDFLVGLPLPVGLFCANDVLARWAIDACHELGLRIPDDVAVVGVDDDATICPFVSPTLTSVAQDDDALFVALLDQLDRLESGRPCAAETIVPPLGVVHRRSTGLDPRQSLAERAMTLIHTAQETTVAGLARRLEVTERSVQRAVLRRYGISPLAAIRDERIARAKRLLAAGQAVAAVAAQVGYASLPAFQDAFRAVCGVGPAAWLARRTDDAPRPPPAA